MSESSRYQNALRYAPGRGVGTYPDARDITQAAVSQVGSRAPMVFAPSVGEVAGSDWTVPAFSPPPASFVQQPMQQAGGGDPGAPGGVDVMGLVARFGPRIANELMKRFAGPDELPPLDAQGWAASLPADHIAYTGFGFDPLPADTGIFIPSMADGVAPVGSGDVVDAMNLTRGGLGFGSDIGADGAGAALDKVAGADGGGGFGLGDLSLSAFRDAIGTGALASGMTSQLGSAFGSGLADVAMGGMSAGAGFLGTNAAYALMDENGSPGNIGTGAAAGAAIGSAILPIFGTAIGALLGGLAGGTINPQPDHQSAFAQFGVNTQGGMDASGIVRNGAPQGTADSLAQQAQQYFADRAAAEGYAPNAAMMNRGFRFGMGQGANGFGGWFLQPFDGDPNQSDVRPDNFALLSGPVPALTADNTLAFVQSALSGNTPQGSPTPGFPTAPQDFGQALDFGWDALVRQGFYAPAGTGPAAQDVAANIDAQRAWAAANPQMVSVSGDSEWLMPVPWADQFTYNPGWAPPQVADAGGFAPYVESNG